MLEQEQQVKGKIQFGQFLGKRWWGLSCLLLVMFFLALAYYPHEMPSDKVRCYMGIVADYREGASCEIMNPPERIEIVVSDGPSLPIEKGAIQGDSDKLPYQVQRTAGAIKVSMLDPNVSPQNAKNIWSYHAPVVELGNGFRRYQISHDVPLMGVTGVYVVRGNTIPEHHFVVRNGFFAIPVFLVAVIYLCVAVVRKTAQLNRGRRSANTGT
jgi:hypothetical protein